MKLLIIMPAYNEEAALAATVREWIDEVSRRVDDFRILIIDDGSTDDTWRIAKYLENKHRGEVLARHTSNLGHGQACLLGYRNSISYGAEFVMQIDSDGQCDPKYFHECWKAALVGYDVVYGVRLSRDDGLGRIIASKILRWWVWRITRRWCQDANVPYRIIRTGVLRTALNEIPPNFDLANVALAVIMQKPFLKHAYIPIHFRERLGGSPSVPIGKFWGKALTLRRQLKQLA